MTTKGLNMQKEKNGVLGDLWKQGHLQKINDDLLELYNSPGMALHFQPTNLRKLKAIIHRLIDFEDHV